MVSPLSSVSSPVFAATTRDRPFTMSVRIMSEVFEKSRTQGNARLVLLALADSCNDDASCWPSIRKIAEKANISEPITKKYLNALIQIGVITRDEREDFSGRQTSNLYTINVEKIGDDEITQDVINQVTSPSRLKTFKGVTAVNVGGDNLVQRAEGVTLVSLSYMNHQKEPKKEPSSDSAIAPSNSSIENEELFTMKVAESPSAPILKKPKRAKLVDDSFIAELKTLNPEINIDAELRKMDTWLLAHPERKKTRPFVTGWINRQSSKLIESKKDTRLPNGEIDWANVKPNM